MVRPAPTLSGLLSASPGGFKGSTQRLGQSPTFVDSTEGGCRWHQDSRWNNASWRGGCTPRGRSHDGGDGEAHRDNNEGQYPHHGAVAHGVRLLGRRIGGSRAPLPEAKRAAPWNASPLPPGRPHLLVRWPPGAEGAVEAGGVRATAPTETRGRPRSWHCIIAWPGPPNSRPALLLRLLLQCSGLEREERSEAGATGR